ncbi:hypothetical protein SDC9_78220 [bioreactor metagenome]|uniref:Uncharacterized protein n=1 Tax=bioreactor metagenome TaxID=1076179 RepID=A0A644YYW9_9ZZZZ
MVMKKHIINKEDIIEGLISKEHYFQSLLQASYSNGLLNTSDIQKIQLQLLSVMTEIVAYFTKGTSSSVREEVAEQLILSIYYTLGLSLKHQKTIKESIDLIKKKDMKLLFAEGEKVLQEKVDKCKGLLEIISRTKLNTENYAYIDTIDYGIPLFFEKYDRRFASHETPGSIDYPLAIEEIHLVGIEYIEDYLNKLVLENKFCEYFDVLEIEALLEGFCNNSKHMLINIFKLVLTNYLGCILVGNKGRALDITKRNREYLKRTIEDLSTVELERLFLDAIEKLCHEFSIKDKKLIEYIHKVISEVIPEVRKNMENNTLDRVFITLSKKDENLIKYEDGKMLDNNKFREITEEIRVCSSIEDKIRLIREEIHSLEDLLDVLGADCIFDDEYIDVFKALDTFEMALIAKNTYNDEEFKTDYMIENEKEWKVKFKEYFESLNAVEREQVVALAKNIEL